MTCLVWGKPKPRTLTALSVRISTRPCAWSRVRSSTGTCCQASRLAALQQCGPVGLDREQVVRVLDGDQELRSLPGRGQRVGGDHGAGQLQAGKQRLEPGDLARGAVDPVLGQHDAAGGLHGRSRWTWRPSRRGPRSVLPSTVMARRRWSGRP
jgi:hypothetical protein